MRSQIATTKWSTNIGRGIKLLSNTWSSDEGRVLKESLLRHPIQPEECWPAILGKKVYIQRGDMHMRPIIDRDNKFVSATNTLRDMSEEQRLQTLCTSADLQAQIGSQRGALIAVRINEIKTRFRVEKYEVVTYTLVGVESGVYH